MDHEEQYPEWWDDGPAGPLHPLGYVLAVLAVIIGLFTACAPPTGGNNPVVVGDSIAFGAQLDGAFNAMPNAFLDNQPGRGMYRKGIVKVNPDGSFVFGTSGAEAIPPLLTRLTPNGWTVIELGTNDLDLPFTEDEASIAELMRLVPGCVAWVNVWNNANDNTRIRSLQFNVALTNAATKRGGCTRVINWAGLVRGMEFTYLKDGVHTTPAGSRKLVELIKAVTG